VNGPLLIVADNAAIARRAMRWAEQFAAAGRLYRVRLAGALGDRDLEGVVAEARSLAAAAVLAAGGPATRALAAAAAAALGLPLVQDEAEAEGGG
jgi:glycerol dehydrogenase-like iron-containing ADH family enzyme